MPETVAPRLHHDERPAQRRFFMLPKDAHQLFMHSFERRRLNAEIKYARAHFPNENQLTEVTVTRHQNTLFFQSDLQQTLVIR